MTLLKHEYKKFWFKEIYFKNMHIGKLSSQRHSLLIRLKYFGTCTVLFSGFLGNERGVLVTALYINYSFGGCGISRCDPSCKSSAGLAFAFSLELPERAPGWPPVAVLWCAASSLLPVGCEQCSGCAAPLVSVSGSLSRAAELALRQEQLLKGRNGAHLLILLTHPPALV